MRSVFTVYEPGSLPALLHSWSLYSQCMNQCHCPHYYTHEVCIHSVWTRVTAHITTLMRSVFTVYEPGSLPALLHSWGLYLQCMNQGHCPHYYTHEVCIHSVWTSVTARITTLMRSVSTVYEPGSLPALLHSWGLYSQCMNQGQCPHYYTHEVCIYSVWTRVTARITTLMRSVFTVYEPGSLPTLLHSWGLYLQCMNQGHCLHYYTHEVCIHSVWTRVTARITTLMRSVFTVYEPVSLPALLHSWGLYPQCMNQGHCPHYYTHEVCIYSVWTRVTACITTLMRSVSTVYEPGSLPALLHSWGLYSQCMNQGHCPHYYTHEVCIHSVWTRVTACIDTLMRSVFTMYDPGAMPALLWSWSLPAPLGPVFIMY